MTPPLPIRRPHELTPADLPVPLRPPGTYEEVEPLLKLCAAGKLYDVEQWIAAGKPIQFPADEVLKRRRWHTPLRTAILQPNHSLAELLLCNGYDPNGDRHSALSHALSQEDVEMVKLLFRHGADPNGEDFGWVLESNDRRFAELFIAAGADPCLDDATARALACNPHASARFAKEHLTRFPCLQRQLDLALHAVTADETAQPVALLLWAGANPHAETPLRPWKKKRDDFSKTAFERAVLIRDDDFLALFLKKPIPPDTRDLMMREGRFDRSPALLKRLLADGADPNIETYCGSLIPLLIDTYLYREESFYGEEKEIRLAVLNLLIDAGAKWNPSDAAIVDWKKRLRGVQRKPAAQLVRMVVSKGALQEGTLLKD